MADSRQLTTPPATPATPAVPPGPGVQPPFVVAPIEGRRARTWLGLGVAGGLLAACCGIGGVAFGGLIVFGTEAVNEQAQRAVSDYVAAIAEQDWEQAHELRCERDRNRLSPADLAQAQAGQPQIETYQVGDLDFQDLTVPVQLTYDDLTGERVEVPVEQSQTGRFEVCGDLVGL
ncbi:MAG TPA: hypothetical protein VIL37_02530 [Natronosporangium sp.]